MHQWDWKPQDPVEMVREDVKPLCFLGAGNWCPLPYFYQKKAWMDTHFYAR